MKAMASHDSFANLSKLSYPEELRYNLPQSGHQTTQALIQPTLPVTLSNN